MPADAEHNPETRNAFDELMRQLDEQGALLDARDRPPLHWRDIGHIDEGWPVVVDPTVIQVGDVRNQVRPLIGGQNLDELRGDKPYLFKTHVVPGLDEGLLYAVQAEPYQRHIQTAVEQMFARIRVTPPPLVDTQSIYDNIVRAYKMIDEMPYRRDPLPILSPDTFQRMMVMIARWRHEGRIPPGQLWMSRFCEELLKDAFKVEPTRYVPDPTMFHLLGTPLVVDDGLPAGAWRYLENGTNRVLYEGMEGAEMTEPGIYRRTNATRPWHRRWLAVVHGQGTKRFWLKYRAQKWARSFDEQPAKPKKGRHRRGR